MVKPDYVTCKNCTHTVNIHYEGECEAYKCTCGNFEK